MGIKGLIQLIKKYAGSAAIKRYSISRFGGMRIAVDTSAIVYQSVLATRSSGKDIVNEKGEITSHLSGIMIKILKMLENNIIPILVFDGKAPSIKQNTIDKRHAIKKNAVKALSELPAGTSNTDETYLKNFKKIYTPSPTEFEELRVMLDLMGIPYICAPGEADVICAWLASRTGENGRRYVKGVATDDSDMLTLGSPYIFKDMLKFINNGHMITVVSLYKTLVKMNLTMDQFTDLCVLLGCDYCDNIPKVGPESAYKYIKEHETISKVITAYREKYPKNDINTKSIFRAQKYFKNALQEIDKSDFTVNDHHLTPRLFQSEQLMDFMCTKHNFDVMQMEIYTRKLSMYYTRLGINKPNNNVYHTILCPPSTTLDICYSTDSDDSDSD